MFLGLDLSLTGTGVVAIDNNYKVLYKARFSVPQKSTERLFHLENLFLNLLNSFQNIKQCCVESPAYGISEGNLFNLGEWNGIVTLNLYKKGLPFIFASPSQVKKYCTGKGKGDKDLILLKTFQNFNEEFDSSDIADAYILSRIARDYYFMKENKFIESIVKAYQNDVLKKIKNSEDEKEESLLK